MTKNGLCVLVFIYIVVGYDSQPQMNITSSSLTIFIGEVNPLVPNVRQFIGIPFAQPPIGALRFKPPVAVINSSPVIIHNATAAANQGGFPLLNCLQLSFLNFSVTVGQEDCLYLDIFLPLNTSNTALLPVIIYIYGGGFQISDPHDPSRIISQYQNVIYVAIRYRLNVFGFMASTLLSASRPGNIQASGLQGFEDQQMAIKWVRDNIQPFGGDPNRITLQGQSSGAMSVCFHLVAPASQGLFQRAITESGGCDVTTTIQPSLSQMEVIGDDITSHFCNSSSDAIACLQLVDAAALLQYGQSRDYFNYFTANAIHPPIDGLVIPDSVSNLFQQNKFAKNVTLLAGTNNAEFGDFIAFKFEPGWQINNLSQSTLSQWVQMYSEGQSTYLNTTYNPYIAPSLPPTLTNYYGLTDALSAVVFQCPVRRTAAYLANNGARSVYLYSFDYVPLSSPFANLSLSVHGQELPFVFNTANSSAVTETIFPVNTFTIDEQLLATTMSLLWIRFAVNGDPNIPIQGEETNLLITQLTQLGGWPAYSMNPTINSSSYLVFANTALGNGSATLRLGISGYHAPLCAAWDQVVPNLTIVKRCAIGYAGPNCSSVVIPNRASGVELNAIFSSMITITLTIFVFPAIHAF